jgi:hypothetical protein
LGHLSLDNEEGDGDGDEQVEGHDFFSFLASTFTITWRTPCLFPDREKSFLSFFGMGWRAPQALPYSQSEASSKVDGYTPYW